jgi:hypothetical protein
MMDVGSVAATHPSSLRSSATAACSRARGYDALMMRRARHLLGTAPQ